MASTATAAGLQLADAGLDLDPKDGAKVLKDLVGGR